MNSDFNLKLGDRIKTARRYAAVWQADLARECGISQGHLSKIECGHSLPSVELLIKIADILKFELDIKFTISEG